MLLNDKEQDYLVVLKSFLENLGQQNISTDLLLRRMETDKEEMIKILGVLIEITRFSNTELIAAELKKLIASTDDDEVVTRFFNAQLALAGRLDLISPSKAS